MNANPWLDIPLSDYEAHMSLPTVAQAQMLAENLSQVLAQFAPRSVAVIGCAGGNGFDRVPRSVTRVVGVDINPDYVAATLSRFGGVIPGLELYVADIAAGPLPFEPVDLIYAGLVLEYVSLPAALKNLSAACRPGGLLVAVLQQPSSKMQAVSPSPFTSLQALGPVMRFVPPGELSECAARFGFTLEADKVTTLKSGKEFAVQIYRAT